MTTLEFVSQTISHKVPSAERHPLEHAVKLMHAMASEAAKLVLRKTAQRAMTEYSAPSATSVREASVLHEPATAAPTKRATRVPVRANVPDVSSTGNVS